METADFDLEAAILAHVADNIAYLNRQVSEDSEGEDAHAYYAPRIQAATEFAEAVKVQFATFVRATEPPAVGTKVLIRMIADCRSEVGAASLFYSDSDKSNSYPEGGFVTFMAGVVPTMFRVVLRAQERGRVPFARADVPDFEYSAGDLLEYITSVPPTPGEMIAVRRADFEKSEAADPNREMGEFYLSHVPSYENYRDDMTTAPIRLRTTGARWVTPVLGWVLSVEPRCLTMFSVPNTVATLEEARARPTHLEWYSWLHEVYVRAPQPDAKRAAPRAAPKK